MSTKNILNCIPNCTRYESAITNLRVATIEDNSEKDVYYSRDQDSGLVEIESNLNDENYEDRVPHVSLIKLLAIHLLNC